MFRHTQLPRREHTHDLCLSALGTRMVDEGIFWLIFALVVLSSLHTPHDVIVQTCVCIVCAVRDYMRRLSATQCTYRCIGHSILLEAMHAVISRPTPPTHNHLKRVKPMLQAKLPALKPRAWRLCGGTAKP